jgi:hypothetical protein
MFLLVLRLILPSVAQTILGPLVLRPTVPLLGETESLVTAAAIVPHVLGQICHFVNTTYITLSSITDLCGEKFCDGKWND